MENFVSDPGSDRTGLKNCYQIDGLSSSLSYARSFYLMHQEESIDPVKEVVFGAVSGMLGKLVEFPFDTIKVRLQASSSESHSTIQMIRYTYANEGMVNGFYKGLKAPLLGACLETSILFTSYNWTSSLFLNHYNKTSETRYNSDTLPFWTKCASGGFAGFAASFLLTPVELIKCQLQVSNLANPQQKSSATYLSLIEHIKKHEGIVGLWNGLTPTMIREVFGTALWFGTYEYVSGYLKINPIMSQDLQLLASGALAGVSFNFFMFPIDTIKSNIQTYEMFHKTKIVGSLDPSFWFISKMLLSRRGGVRNLYNGLGITLIRAIPANALIFYSYEVLKRNFWRVLSRNLWRDQFILVINFPQIFWKLLATC